MKALFASLIIFAVLLAGISANCVYINRISKDLQLQAKRLENIYDPTTLENLEKLKKHFKKHEKILLLSSSYITVNKVDDSIDGAIAYARSKDESGFQNAKAVLTNAIYDLSRLEKFSIKNIL